MPIVIAIFVESLAAKLTPVGRLPQMLLFVFVILCTVRKLFATNLAFVRLVVQMHRHVPVEVARRDEALPTLGALELFITFMNGHVHFEAADVSETSPTLLATVFLHAGMKVEFVLLAVAEIREAFTADVAFERLDFEMGHGVPFEHVDVDEFPLAQVALVGLFDAVQLVFRLHFFVLKVKKNQIYKKSC